MNLLKKNSYLLILITTILFLPQTNFSQVPNQVTNGSFEIGSFTGWVKSSTQSSHYCTSWTIESSGRVCYGNATAVQQGSREVLAGFDGSGGVMTLYQDVVIPPLPSTRLTFSYRAQTLIGNVASLNRIFNVEIRDTSNNVLETVYTYVAESGGIRDSGWRTEQLIIHSYSGQTIRLAFVLIIPQAFQGPGQFELDDVKIESFATTAAGADVGGVVQSENGYGIRNAFVSFVDSEGVTRTTRTNQFGHFRFNDVEVGNTYVFQVRHRRHRFINGTQVINVQNARKDITFTAESLYKGDGLEIISKPLRE